MQGGIATMLVVKRTGSNFMTCALIGGVAVILCVGAAFSDETGDVSGDGFWMPSGYICEWGK